MGRDTIPGIVSYSCYSIPRDLLVSCLPGKNHIWYSVMFMLQHSTRSSGVMSSRKKTTMFPRHYSAHEDLAVASSNSTLSRGFVVLLRRIVAVALII